MISRHSLRRDSLQLLDIRIQHEQAFLRLAQDLCEKTIKRIISLESEKRAIIEKSEK